MLSAEKCAGSRTLDARRNALTAARSPALHIVLMQPEIPQNTGSIARLAAATKSRLHLIEPLGFSLEDRYLRRAGLDYWPLVDLRTYPGWDAFSSSITSGSLKFFSTHASKSYLQACYTRGNYLVFGCETKGLGAEFLRDCMEDTYRIPIFEPGVRSLNLANAVSIVVYEALRQMGAIR